MEGALKIALVQCPLLWEDAAGNIEAMEARLRHLAPDTELVVLPEMFTTGFTMNPQNIPPDQDPETLHWMQQKAEALDVAITGSIVFKAAEGYYNRLFFVYPDGSYHSYDKRHTFTLAGEDKVYRAGKARLLIEYKGFRICPLICYDLRFPVWSRNTDAYDLLLYVANWPAPRILAWDTLLRSRAIENMAYCAGVNRIGTDGNNLEYTGHSAVYDPMGAQKVFSDKEEIIYAVLDLKGLKEIRSKFRFLEDRDDFKILG